MLVALLMGGMIYLSYMHQFGSEIEKTDDTSVLYITYAVLVCLCILYKILVK